MIERRSIAELEAKYELEPGLDDIYVEGEFDKEIIDKAYAEIEKQRPVFFIGDIEVPSELVESHGLTIGNKQRVIALSRVFKDTAGSGPLFLIDRDLDDITGPDYSHGNLVYSKYSDMEGVFLSEAIQKELMIDAACARIDDFEAFLSFARDFAETFSAIRLMALQRGWKNKLIPPIKQVNFKTAPPTLDYKVSLAVNFSSGNVNGVTDECLAEFFSLKSCLEKMGFRRHCHGHTYIDLLRASILAMRGKRSIEAALNDILILLVPKALDCILSPLRPRNTPN